MNLIFVHLAFKFLCQYLFVLFDAEFAVTMLFINQFHAIFDFFQSIAVLILMT